MKRYPAYKPSGVEWLGEVPEGWEVAPLKAQFSIVGGTTPKSDNPNYWNGDLYWITPADLSGLPDRFIRDTGRRISSLGLDSCGTTLVAAGAIALSTRAPIGSIAITLVEACTNQGCRLLAPANGVVSGFYYYVLLSEREQLNLLGRGSTFLELSGDQLGSFRVPLPPLAEQHAIAGFLERETAKIDGLLAEQRRLIALLAEKRQAVISHAVTRGLNPDAPLKPSGIDWLGDIPEGWELVQLRRLVDEERRVTYGIVQPGEPDPEGRFMVRGQDYSFGWADPDSIFRVSAAIEEPYRRARLQQGDLVLTIVGAGTGNVAIVPSFLDGANITQTTARIAPSGSMISSEYLGLLFQSHLGKSQVRFFQKGAAQPGLNLEHLVAFRFPLPTEAEQAEITAVLRSSVNNFDTLTETATSAITLLQERRAALISAAVTGKIDVREVAPGEQSSAIEAA